MAVEIQKQLLEALKKIDRPGTFCTSGLLPPMVAGLEVEGIGAVALPLGKRDAAALKKQARQAPYGKGVKTVVDTYVRRVWEIDAEQVALTNPQWSTIEPRFHLNKDQQKRDESHGHGTQELQQVRSISGQDASAGCEAGTQIVLEHQQFQGSCKQSVTRPANRIWVR